MIYIFINYIIIYLKYALTVLMYFVLLHKNLVKLAGSDL